MRKYLTAVSALFAVATAVGSCGPAAAPEQDTALAGQVNLDAAFDVRGDRLVWRRRWQADLSVHPVSRDRVLRGLGVDSAVAMRLHFTRDASGRLMELMVSTPPAEDSV